jgi:Protein of unknown function (DUF3040)
MALSMDEQRMLAEIEKRLAADDPGLASCMSTFRRPGPGTVLRSPRARIIGSLFTVLLVAMVSLMIYAMIPFRPHTVRNTVTHPPGTQQAISAAGGSSTLNQSDGHLSGPASAKALDAGAKPTGASVQP